MAMLTSLTSLPQLDLSETVDGIELIVSDEHLIVATPDSFSDAAWDATMALIESHVTSTDIDYRTQAFFDDESKRQLYVFTLRAAACSLAVTTL